MNKVIFLGRVTKDPVVKSGESTTIANFSLAIERYGKQGEDSQADFPRITLFGKNAEHAQQYVKKGQLVLVEGYVRTNSFTNKDGEKVYTTDFIGERFKILIWNTTDSKEE